MSQGLNKVKKRIQAVENTKKITSAMKLVSSVKFSKLSKEISNRKDYYAYLNDLATTCFSAAKINQIDVPYIRPNPNVDKRLIIVVSSSMGMCGAYNMNIKKLLEDEYKNGDEILLIGKTLLNELKNENLKINETFIDLFSDLSVSNVRSLSKYLIKVFLEKEYKEIDLLYTRYINSISFLPTKISLLPVTFKMDKKSGLNHGDFEPGLSTFCEEFVRRYLLTDLYFKLYDSYLSEVASRRNAMDNADKNAEDLIDKLTLEFNKARQASITQEITEVVNGSKNK